jgi:hypothetical protein
MGWDPDCEGALCCSQVAVNEEAVVFPDRKSARQAIQVSLRYAQLCMAQGKPVNTDFLDDRQYVKVVKVRILRRVQACQSPT